MMRSKPTKWRRRKPTGPRGTSAAAAAHPPPLVPLQARFKSRQTPTWPNITHRRVSGATAEQTGVCCFHSDGLPAGCGISEGPPHSVCLLRPPFLACAAILEATLTQLRSKLTDLESDK